MPKVKGGSTEVPEVDIINASGDSTTTVEELKR